MSISKLISRMAAGKPEKRGETMSYDAVFKGATSRPEVAAANFLPGLRAVVGSSRVDLQACKLEYSIVSPK